MIYTISHQISYTYSAPVFLEPHIFRLRPRCDAAQGLLDFTLTADPNPAGRHDFLDPEGNGATCLWFEEKIDSLTVSTNFTVETFCTNPFGYLVTDDTFFDLPVSYGVEEGTSLVSFLADIEQDAAIEKFTGSIRREVKDRTIDFLSRLCTAIYESIEVEIRHVGRPHPPSVTLASGKGACRDLALLFVAACRSVGIAARFVSGYQEGDANTERPDLHAWAEVYIPGGGWRGYDPTHGLAVADRHIVLAASCGPAGAAPLQGAFRGTGISADMDYRIQLSQSATRAQNQEHSLVKR